MKKIYLIILFVMVAATARLAAQRNLFALEYSIGYTVGDFHDFVGKTTFRGMNLDYRNLVTDNIGVGFEIGWNHFWEEKPYDTYTRQSVSLSGKQYRYSFVVPMLVSANYYFKPGEMINPFVGFGIGTEYSRNDLDMGLYEIYDDVWHFAIKPELGIVISPSPNIGIIIVGKYYDAMASGNVGKRSYITSNIGLMWNY